MKSRTLVILTAVAFLVAYLSAPIFALKGLADGFQHSDAEQLNQYVDFPAVRSSMKEQVSASMLADPKMAGNAFAMALGPMVINQLVDNLVTPSGLAAIIAKGKADTPGAVKRDVEVEMRSINFSKLIDMLSVRGPFEFRLIPPSNEAKKVEVVFKNLGVFNWKLSDIRLPAGAFAKQ